eukprot:4737842-Pyramimonas_sp.AAC.1
MLESELRMLINKNASLQDELDVFKGKGSSDRTETGEAKPKKERTEAEGSAIDRDNTDSD